MLKAQALSRCSVPRVQPFSCLPRRGSVVVRAAENNGVVTTTTTTAPATANMSLNTALTFTQDAETIKDVFSFAGPAPERVNGRVAMYAFAAMAYTELNAHTPALEQFGQQWFGVIFFSLLITLGSLVPKLASGVPLKELHATATTNNMTGPGWRQFVGLFDGNLELWTGRVAMIGVAGLIASEVIKGDSFF